MSAKGAKPAKSANTLVLFSDGTGNSSAKLFKTNVWRMYQAVDLGTSRGASGVQVAYYDNGVGTQSIKFLAILTGIFGMGLKNNVLRLYRFACRNGAANCRIYCFGFSRGAFTIRLVAALIAEYGLVKYSSEAELNARTLDTFRAFMRTNDPNVAAFVGKFGRGIRDAAIWLRRNVIDRFVHPKLLKPAEYKPVTVEFIGVWDTVAAYGGPIAELTRGIDDYLWPLSMTDSCLSTKVGTARHALSIDDERDSFQPVLWDERDWHLKAAAAHPGDEVAQAAFRGRLKQVWFAGMHSDVGGGYPDESLSYVSLIWMMDEARKAGLRLLRTPMLDTARLSNSLGPIHNSRGGLGVYYRPQPRKIAAFLHPASGMDFEAETLSLRDPVLGENPKPPHGVLMGCTIHESVAARLLDGTDDYAPATLPPQVSVEPYSDTARLGGNPDVSDAQIALFTTRDDDWYQRQERIWDFVLWRRVAYFAAVIATVLLVSMPLWADALPYPIIQDGRAVMQRMTSWSQYLPLAWAGPWIHAWEVNWVLFFALLVAALVLSGLGGWLQAKARNRTHALWRARLAGRPYDAWKLPGTLTKLRNSATYQRGLQILKWRVLPAFAAATLVFAMVWLGLAALTQYTWSFNDPMLCNGLAPAKKGAHIDIAFDTRQPCVPLAMVRRGHRYQITVEVPPGLPWADDTVPADPVGVRRALWTPAYGSAGPAVPLRERPPLEARVWQWLGAPFRRVIDGRYMQPVVRLRAFDEQTGVVPRSVVHLLHPVSSNGRFYTDVFDAPADGELFVYVNDAAFLCRYDTYGNNRGSAVITIDDLDDAPDPATEISKSTGPNWHDGVEDLWFNWCPAPERSAAAATAAQAKPPDPGAPAAAPAR